MAGLLTAEVAMSKLVTGCVTTKGKTTKKEEYNVTSGRFPHMSMGLLASTQKKKLPSLSSLVEEIMHGLLKADCVAHLSSGTAAEREYHFK